jgi:hypothetical protein
MAEKATTPKRTTKKDAPKEEPPQVDPLAHAIASEQMIRERAETIRGNKPLDRAMLRQLMPLLMEPIPAPFIQKVGKVKGKPYESTGIKSVQVQMDRLSNVLGPSNWGYLDEYEESGRLCKVAVQIIDDEGNPLVTRTSFGGVDHASNLGNLYKGSFTNAAKLAIARLGPGHEVYIGFTDLDPDVSEEAAAAAASVADRQQEAQARASKPKGETLTDEQLDEVRTIFKARQVTAEEWRMFLLSHGVERTADLPTGAFEAAKEWLETKDEKE